MDKFKQVIVVNESLQLPRGKLAAQVAHAAVAAMFAAEPDVVEGWLAEGMPKIVLQVPSEVELLGILNRARTAKLPVEPIRDAGRTVIPEGTLTCIGIGPAPVLDIDTVTALLKLLR